MSKLSVEQIWELLEDVKDPEIPVVSVVEMGIVRAVEVDGERVLVRMTPTFSGCPALQAIQEGIRQHLLEHGAGQVELHVSLFPAWTSDWITAPAHQKLREFGLAPPARRTGWISLSDLEPATCPYCSSQNTVLKNSFGPTLCRSIYVCNGCRQPFEQIKAV